MKYFATLPKEQIGNELISKVKDYNEYLLNSGLIDELRRSYAAYYGDSTIQDAGVQGELKKMRVNNYSNLIKHILNMVTANRPAWEPRASNSDSKSQSQTILAQGLLDYYMRENRLERLLKQCTENALFLKECALSATWDVTSGEIYGVTGNGSPIYQGDIKYQTHLLTDLIRDFKQDNDDFDWIIIREYKNKFDLVSKYPEFASKLESITESKEDELKYKIKYYDDYSKGESTKIPFYTFFHKKSESVPNGRMIQFCSNDTILFDGPLPYRKIPVYRITASSQVETAFGHSPAMDLLPLQEAMDVAFSTVLTNQAAFGVQNVMIPKGSGISVTQISGGLNLVEYEKESGPPQPLNLTQTPPEIFNFINLLNQMSESISGVNSVARGNASPSLSGAAMALLQSTALQFSSGLQQSYTALLEDVGTATIHLLTDFAAVPRIANLAGKHNKGYIKEFKGSDLESISRVTVDSANALTKSTAGRVEIANQLLSSGLIEDSRQYLMVIQTGQLEPMLESETSQLIRIRSENEMLSEGKRPKALISDPHEIEIREHLSVLDSPEVRENPEVVQAVLDHVQEHLDLARNMPPELMQILGRQPLAAQAPQALPGVMDSTLPITEQAQNVNLPNAPIDPLTGQPTLANGPQ
jgi:hypothetical protein